ncbi:hypothetical protein [Geothrix sp. 21YS21S-4]|uniref:hypothetical protein n=1 Tax=Geothrix sp. 21YS21S-4 TaxID=3068889 RepID=UPI0027BAF40F|nr:hypothetical protein [Geothrix sp. 21YS21S-4]
MEWTALKHALLAHLPVATGLLLPWALLASQRAGRGIRPWWTVARYLGLAGAVGLLAALVSGVAAGWHQALIPRGHLFPAPAAGHGMEGLLFRHAVLALASLPLGAGAVWAMTRRRKDHQSLGLLALFLGLGWCAALLAAGYSGFTLAHRTRSEPAPVAVLPPPPAPVPPDPEAAAPLRALDFAALEPIQSDPVKSPAHGGRWIRAWASPGAAAAYRAGQPLPVGAFIVLSTWEDRWGRPGPDPGPVYALEMKESGPSLTFYWPRVPAERQSETGGQARVYWRGQDAGLDACRTCHAAGMADPAQRSRWRVPKLKIEATESLGR